MNRYSVLIPISESNYQYAPFDNDTLIGEIPAWLRERFSGGWTWQAEGSFLHFRFRDEHAAFRFKMRWG